MAGSRHLDPALRPAPGIVQAPRALDRDDLVVARDDREHRDAQRGRVRFRVVAVGDHRAHERGREVVRTDRLDAVVGRDEHDAIDRSLRRESHRDAAAEAAPHRGDATLHVRSRGQRVEQRDRVSDERLFGGLAAATAEPAVVHERHRASAEAVGVRDQPRHLLGVPAEVGDGAHRRGRRHDEPSAHDHVAGALERQRLDAPSGRRRGHGRHQRLRMEQQRVLERAAAGQHRCQGERDGDAGGSKLSRSHRRWSRSRLATIVPAGAAAGQLRL